MSILFLNTSSVTTEVSENSILTDCKNILNNNSEWIETLCIVLTLVLGVATFLIGINYVYSKRQNARYGFYINLLVLIERIDLLLTSYPDITQFVVLPELRDKWFGVSKMLDSRSDIILPQFVLLADKLVAFISSAEDNIPPEGYKLLFIKIKKDSWNNWYSNILIITRFFQKVKLAENNLTPYFSDAQKSEYDNEVKDFVNAINSIKEQLKNKISY